MHVSTQRHSYNFDFICLSFHPEKNEADKFFKTFKHLSENYNCVNPTARLMMHNNEELWSRSESLFNLIVQEQEWYTVQCVRIVDNYDGDAIPKKYDDSKLEFLKATRKPSN